MQILQFTQHFLPLLTLVTLSTLPHPTHAHNYAMSCKNDRDYTESCQGTYGFYCDKNGVLQTQLSVVDQDCALQCECVNLVPRPPRALASTSASGKTERGEDGSGSTGSRGKVIGRRDEVVDETDVQAKKGGRGGGGGRSRGGSGASSTENPRIGPCTDSCESGADRVVERIVMVAMGVFGVLSF